MMLKDNYVLYFEICFDDFMKFISNTYHNQSKQKGGTFTMEDLTLKSDLYNNVKFHMQKLILDVPENDCERLGGIFDAEASQVQALIDGFEEAVAGQAELFLQNVQRLEVPVKKTIAYIGDSITSERESHLNILKKVYENEKNLVFVDAAVSGDKSDDAKMKLPIRVLDYKPDIVHILIGTNDLRINEGTYGCSCVSPEEFARNLDYIISTLKEMNAKVIISTVSPVINDRLQKRFPDDHWYYRKEDIDAFNDIIAQTAQKHQIRLNDMRELYGQYPPEELMLQDGLHLNPKGQQMLAQRVHAAIAECL